jgi:ankyrin repeat protein
MSMKLKNEEVFELRSVYSYLVNYSSDDPTDPIDPLTYVAPDGDNCLHIACRRGDLNSARLLLKGGININAQGDMGYTALHCAKKCGYTKIVQLLMENGASSKIKNEFGKLP